MKTLAEHLGVSLDAPTPTADATATTPEKLSPKAFCQGIVDSHEFRSYLLAGLIAGDIPTPLLLRVLDIAWGKPTERIEMDVTTSLEELSIDQLEQRALFLVETAKRLRAAETSIHEPVEHTPDSVIH